MAMAYEDSVKPHGASATEKKIAMVAEPAKATCVAFWW